MSLKNPLSMMAVSGLRTISLKGLYFPLCPKEAKLIVNKRVVKTFFIITGQYYCLQREEAWRCGGFLARKFNRIPKVEPCTCASQKRFSRPIAKPMLAVGFIFFDNSAS